MKDKTVHHFSNGVYAKEIHLKKGEYAITHKHKYDHLSIVGSGRVLVELNGTDVSVHTAGSCINIPANVAHAIYAVEDSVWFCIHATTETDPEKVDNVLIAS